MNKLILLLVLTVATFSGAFAIDFNGKDVSVSEPNHLIVDVGSGSSVANEKTIKNKTVALNTQNAITQANNSPMVEGTDLYISDSYIGLSAKEKLCLVGD